MIQFSVVYNINNKLRANGTSALQIRAYKNRRRKYFTTALFIKPTQWSKKHSQVIDHPNAFQINADLRRRLNDLEGYTLELMQKHGEVTLEQLEGYFKYDGGGSFTKFWIYELEHDTRLTKSTKKKHKTALNYWMEFQKDVLFSELTFTLIRDMFLFSCYTGLRFADVCSITHSNIDQDKAGLVLNISAQKTKKQLLLPLYQLHKGKPQKALPSRSRGACAHFSYLYQSILQSCLKDDCPAGEYRKAGDESCCAAYFCDELGS